jgi:hypothetical protein
MDRRQGLQTDVEPAERLFVPNRKRLSHTYALNDEGVRELRVYYGLKEITFDDDRYFAFGERLVTEPSFTGLHATTWGPGYAWEELRPLLEELLQEGVLERGEPSADPRGGGVVPSPLTPSVCPALRFWTLAECEAITHDLANHAVELGHLEAILPVYRVAHAALDGDGRQVGEANVVPTRLRLDIATEWRACQYPGSRFRDEVPMNVTALKAMIKHWKPIVAMITRLRAAVRDRLEPSSAGDPESWTIGELHVLACVVLALPAYQLMKVHDRPPPPVHPVMSSLFRITDGIRMTTSAMQLSIGHQRNGDEPTNGAEVYAYADRYGMLLSKTGVCAGPKHMIDEFLRTAVDGVRPKGIEAIEGEGIERIERIEEPALPAELDALWPELPEALDYGFYGLQVWAVTFSVWLAMSRVHQELLALLEPVAEDPTCTRLAARLRADLAPLELLQIVLDHDRNVHFKTYADTYKRSWRGSRIRTGPRTLAEATAPMPEAAIHQVARTRLRGLLDERFAGLAHGPDIDRIVDALVLYLREEQAILAVATELQEVINRLVGRPRPSRALTVRDLLVMYFMHELPDPFRYVFDTIEDELGIHIECTATAIDISDRRLA